MEEQQCIDTPNITNNNNIQLNGVDKDDTKKNINYFTYFSLKISDNENLRKTIFEPLITLCGYARGQYNRNCSFIVKRHADDGKIYLSRENEPIKGNDPGKLFVLHILANTELFDGTHDDILNEGFEIFIENHTYSYNDRGIMNDIHTDVDGTPANLSINALTYLKSPVTSELYFAIDTNKPEETCPFVRFTTQNMFENSLMTLIFNDKEINHRIPVLNNIVNDFPDSPAFKPLKDRNQQLIDKNPPLDCYNSGLHCVGSRTLNVFRIRNFKDKIYNTLNNYVDITHEIAQYKVLILPENQYTCKNPLPQALTEIGDFLRNLETKGYVTGGRKSNKKKTRTKKRKCASKKKSKRRSKKSRK